MTMQLFTRNDGRTLQVIEGLEERVLAAAQFAPRDDWTDEKYTAKAHKKIRQSMQFVDQYERFGGSLENAQALEVACGGSIECVLIALHPVRSVVGIDVELSLFDPGSKGVRMRRLANEVLRLLGVEENVNVVLQQRPIRFATMDATRMSFADNSFDLVWSHSAMEHIIPPETALAEMARIVRLGGLIYHAIDPFYWLKGCHKGGVVDVPWAHARLTPDDYYRFVAEHEGESNARKRSAFLQTLNHFTPRQWRKTIESGPFDILDWKEERWPLAEAMLAEHPDVRDTLLDGIEPGDLTCREIKVWLRNT
jgi:SAM-dependent methyltransferase